VYGIRCLRCGSISQDQYDIEHCHCGRCRVFHDRARRYDRAQHRHDPKT
jgi:hypothetical protein